MKNLLFKTFVLVFLLTIVLANVKVIDSYALPNLYSEGIYLMDATTGKVLYEKNADVQYMPASTTKIMTAIIALENCKLTDEVTIGENPPKADGSSIGIEQGEVYTIEELLYGLLLESGNDCAEAIAEHIAGSNEAFAKIMNEKAKELGATNTNFKNPSGLTEDGHLTTAHDLALIMRYASQNSDFVRIAQTPSYFYANHPYSNGSEKWATNHNPLLKENSPYKYQYAYCGKTGYTTAANHSYAATVIKDQQELVGTFLNATDKDGLYTSVGQLFDWGFENFKTEKIVSTGDKLADYSIDSSTSIPLVATKDIYYTFNIGEGEDVTKSNTSVKYDNKDLTTTSIKKGDILFNAALLVNGTKASDIELASDTNREYTAEVMVKNTVTEMTSSKYFIPGIIGIVIIIILILISIIRSKRRKKSFLSRRSYIRNKHNF
ncbi:D-alanyl-D-alanine carboxypeptidase family protein [Clostridium sp. D53t1_180928_C8]|uniref:D-alanyl-D-alanine carboxypeptidase family protein n=1 Tax=Clostridium sp. D53t1_180928_C8 TaxID=2787101 RepID=UPI0018A9FBA2|nr:D-alanyl-D-alanine carboxypeptidase family protein [Clostridium sp. D53t1_180928_C8]